MTDWRRARKLDPAPVGGEICPELPADIEEGIVMAVGDAKTEWSSSFARGDV
jgi:hypothetical protein